MKSTAVRLGCFLLATAVFATTTPAQVVPGTGKRIDKVGDDFEDPGWSFVPEGPKSSKEQDEQIRYPTGYSTNKRWFEGVKRGYPDVVRRVPTPVGGIVGSEGALLLQSLRTGVPGRISLEMQQDDFVMSSASRIGTLPVSRSPSVVTHVFLPEFSEWEDRTGTQFGFRLDLKTTITETEEFTTRRGLFRIPRRSTRTVQKQEPYWPGFFIQFHSSTEARFKEDSAALIMRGDELGHEKAGPKVHPGWLTLGMSVTPDGRVHYYAREGIGELRTEDHVYSSFPYTYRAHTFSTAFFNVVNKDDGRTWSTPWIVDDTALYTLR